MRCSGHLEEKNLSLRTFTQLDIGNFLYQVVQFHEEEGYTLDNWEKLLCLTTGEI